MKDSLAAPNFVKIAQEDSYLWGKLLSKIRFFCDFELFKPTFLYL